ncbi:MAG TPA: MFS transporter [Capillimicrobium sp.]|nr:MFS transporter [Capillimicrobium sp.]
MSPRTAVTLVFAANGALFASWASRVPAFAERTDASPGTLGLALLGPAVGAVIAMPIVGRRLPGRSSARFCAVALPGLAAAVVLPGLAPSVALLALALAAVGVANGSLDVAMNVQGVTVERRLRRPILSSLHAAFSFGAFAGAGLGAAAAAADVAPAPHLLAAAAIFGLPGALALRGLVPRDDDPDAGARPLPLRRLPRRLAILGAAAFACLLAEGASSDWSATLVSGPLGGSQAYGAVVFAVFSAAMGGGRLLADPLWARWGAVRLLRRAGALGAAGFGLALLVGTAPAALAGFTALGLGLSGVVPTLFRAAADQPGVATGPAIAAVSSVGYLGFLAGPPIVGGLAELLGLRTAAVVLAVASALVAASAAAAAPPRAAGRPDPRLAARASAP